MFEKLEMLPADAILGLTEAFKKDANPNKINLGVGVYKDETAQTPIFDSVKKAEEKILQSQTSKSYLPIPGSDKYAAVVQGLIFGPGSEVITNKRAVTAQTPGGTGGLRIAGAFLKNIRPSAKLWVSDPTWANHLGIFSDAGFEVKTYPYYNPADKSLNFKAMINALKQIEAGDIILLHGCCHNPTGVDPSLEQWKQIASVLVEQKLLPLIDFAYQGLADGIEADAAGARLLTKSCGEVVIVNSFSKNFGLYNERVGGVTVVCDSQETAEKVFSHMKIVIRRCYSNPPSHGASIVTMIINDPKLRNEWEAEVKGIRSRIHQMRELFVKTLKEKGADRDFSFIVKQNGMFSFSGLNKSQVDKLREKYSIYIVGSGRINVAGMTPGNMDGLCDAIVDVL